MVKKEFNLSEKIEESPSSQAMILYLPSVKEFIEKLREDFFSWIGDNQEDLAVVNAIINKRAGDLLL